LNKLVDLPQYGKTLALNGLAMVRVPQGAIAYRFCCEFI